MTGNRTYLSHPLPAQCSASFNWIPRSHHCLPRYWPHYLPRCRSNLSWYFIRTSLSSRSLQWSRRDTFLSIPLWRLPWPRMTIAKFFTSQSLRFFISLFTSQKKLFEVLFELRELGCSFQSQVDFDKGYLKSCQYPLSPFGFSLRSLKPDPNFATIASNASMIPFACHDGGSSNPHTPCWDWWPYLSARRIVGPCAVALD